MALLRNRVVMVTGATGALGTAVAEHILQQGARVVGVARQIPPAPASDWIGIAADLTDAEGAKQAVEQTLAHAGRLDAVIHTAGGFAGGQTLEATTDEAWQQMWAVNVTSAFQLLRAVLPGFKQQRYGRIVAIGSRAGAQPAATLSAYGASKAALNMLIQVAAEEGREFHVTANVLAPSTIDTPANRAAMPQADASRWVKPAVLAAHAAWLISEEAGDISGAVIPVYGNA